MTNQKYDVKIGINLERGEREFTRSIESIRGRSKLKPHPYKIRKIPTTTTEIYADLLRGVLDDIRGVISFITHLRITRESDE